MTHGTRACYQHGCRQTPCRAAEAAYRHALRLQHVKGQAPLGSLIAAATAEKMVKGLLVEHLSLKDLGQRLGLKYPGFRFYSDRMTLARFQRLRRFYRAIMAEGPDTPLDANG